MVNEALRVRTPVLQSIDQYFKQDVKLGNYNIKANEVIEVHFDGIHFNKNEWQRPYEFLPERFDTSNPLSLTPSGKTRNPFSLIPFNGGKRICFGKTFAECMERVIVVYLASHFNFEMDDKSFTANNPPINCAAMSKIEPIHVKLTEYRLLF